jgi:hypothetical protein
MQNAAFAILHGPCRTRTYSARHVQIAVGLLAFTILMILPASSTRMHAQEKNSLKTRGDEQGDVVFREDFSKGADRWEPTDAASWELMQEGQNTVFGLNKRVSAYEPKVRSPHNIALIRDLTIGDVAIEFSVRSTKDTGNHRDCCVFFGYQDPEHFYYVHLGAKPDPASGQIMIVDGAPRRPLTQNTSPVPWDDQWHRVRLERHINSGKIAIYFDAMDEPLMQVEDKTFGAGRVGIGSFDDQNAFDDCDRDEQCKGVGRPLARAHHADNLGVPRTTRCKSA